MKLVCGCGNEVNFVKPEDPKEQDTDEYGTEHRVKDDRHAFDFNTGHDEVFIGCNRCGKTIHLWA